MEFRLHLTSKIPVSTEGAGLTAVFTIDDIAAGNLSMPLDHEGLFYGVLDTLDLKFLATNGAAEKALNHSRTHGMGRRLVFMRKLVVMRDITLGLKGTLHREADAFLVKFCTTTVTLTDGKFATEQGVDSVEGKLS